MTTQMEMTNSCIETCNSLLRGEISAVEAYSKVIERFGIDPIIADIVEIQYEHIKNVDLLCQNIKKMGGEPVSNSGAWGDFVTTLQSTANFLGEDSAIKLLIQGESHGQSEYLAALKNEDVLPGCKDLIQQKLLPPIAQHLVKLNRLQS